MFRSNSSKHRRFAMLAALGASMLAGATILAGPHLSVAASRTSIFWIGVIVACSVAQFISHLVQPR
ncbi:MAG: hypothetical protein WBQ86_15200 [Candidatus Binatus sp.]